MADFNSPKAAGRDLSQPKTPSVMGNKSNQEQMTGSGIFSEGPKPSASNGNKFISDTPRQFSNQVQFAANNKGTGFLRTTTALGVEKLKGITYKPAAANPGPEGRSQPNIAKVSM